MSVPDISVPHASAAARAGLQQRIRDRLHLATLRRRPATPWNRLVLAFALIGPGLLVMLGDNDAGGVLTYAQTGAAYGLGLFLPLMLVLGFVAYVVQEMTIRLGAVTRRGHAELIWKRYGPFWGIFSLVDLVLANILTLVTEFLGIRIGGEAFGIPYGLSVPLTLGFVVMTLVFLRYWAWERIALFIAALNLVFVPLVLMAHPHWDAVARAFAGSGWVLPGGVLSATFLILLSANIGTSIAPWQLFFQQSCVVDKGLLPKDIPASRRDLMLGVGGMVLVAIAVIVLGAVALSGLPDAKNLTTEAVLSALQQRLGETAMKLFALGLIEAGLIATIVITASTGWAIGEALDLPRSLNASPGQAWRFYAPAVMGTVVAAGVVLFPNLPIGFLNLSVQVIATVFMPAAMLFLLMLLNDRELMGEHANGPVRNALSVAIMLGLIACNVLYGLVTVFPHIFGGNP
ncbi:metal transporter [Rhodanobacter sp. FW510-R12]|uniref:NRAMP family divalent metal transporter n=1 Tax=unclassified Rhodanobacter TaxID=2621553 RepID=UPI0003FE559B|nr:MULTISPECIES: divalent metal cation transporter [unclassified Rhodanobacter]KZC17507.1 metal transporter [Rhodanobacter sp. FW104-R8]KZC28405.1 metal transporter [Rhodanobacter sp. FW510-T8]KZC32432.1 metal transporter [Rhodanobacter sp. FW510-R10]MDE2226089.1 divalent metal cation transporter [Xanthomonadaceae bacterium]